MLTNDEAFNMQYWYWFTHRPEWGEWLNKHCSSFPAVDTVLRKLSEREPDTLHIFVLWRMHGSPTSDETRVRYKRTTC